MILIGFMLGASFTREAVLEIFMQLHVIIVTTGLLIGLSIISGIILSELSNVSIQTGILGSIPGGLIQMVALSRETAHVDSSLVTVMQLIRIILVFFFIPFFVFYFIMGDVQSVDTLICSIVCWCKFWNRAEP